MTYAFKYMWLRTFAIPTGEDPDKVSSDELDDLQRKAEEKRKAMNAVCEDCGAALAPVRARDGSVWDVATQVLYTKGTTEKPGRFGRILCPACQKKALKDGA